MTLPNGVDPNVIRRNFMDLDRRTSGMGFAGLVQSVIPIIVDETTGKAVVDQALAVLVLDETEVE